MFSMKRDFMPADLLPNDFSLIIHYRSTNLSIKHSDGMFSLHHLLIGRSWSQIHDNQRLMQISCISSAVKGTFIIKHYGECVCVKKGGSVRSLKVRYSLPISTMQTCEATPFSGGIKRYPHKMVINVQFHSILSENPLYKKRGTLRFYL